jgi:hypothetical protein
MASPRFRSFSGRAAALLAVGAFTLSVAASPAMGAASPTTASAGSGSGSSQASARLGAGYLARQIVAGGGHLEFAPGLPDISDTAYAVIGLNAAGVGGKQVKSGIAFLKTQLANLESSAGDGTDDPGLLGYITMAAVASNEDPYHFGGRKPLNNLVARLQATVRTTGPDAGLFGTADPTFDGAFRQGVSLAALAAADVPARKVASSIRWLEAQQCANGLWQSYRIDVRVACAPADPNSFSGPDTNSTGMAVQGLAAFGHEPRTSKTVASLRAVRSTDGGYPYIAAAGQSSDPNSTALVIQALLAADASPGAALSALASYQLGCSDAADDRGAYFYPFFGRTANILATVQAVPAAALKPLPVGPSNPSNAVPVTPCPAPTSSVSAGRATVAATSATVKAAVAGTAGPCSGTSGVTVSVDFKAFGGTQQTRCAPGKQASGVAALQNAGFTPAGTTRYGLAFVCRINNLPAPAQQPCVNTPPGNAYWAYYHALAGATTWTYSSLGAASYVPPLGSIDAWAFGSSAKPTKTPAQVRAGQ